MAARETVVNEALIGAFQRDGCAVLRGLFTPWIEGLCAGVVENMASPSFRERKLGLAISRSRRTAP